MRHPLIIALILWTIPASAEPPRADTSPKPDDATELADDQERDLQAFHDRMYAFGPRPSEDAVARTVARAKAHPDDVRWLFWSGQFGVDGRVTDYDWMAALKRAADKEYPPAMALYGMVLCGATGTPATDVTRGVELIHQAATKDDEWALYQLATLYAVGCPGIPADDKNAQALANRALDRGMLRGLDLLASIYARRGDAATAGSLTLRAIDAGSPASIGRAVQSCIDGKAPDPAKAVVLLRRGALVGDPDLMEQFATALETRLGGLEQDRVLARGLLRQAIATGSHAAETDWARGQVTGEFGIGRDVPAGLARLRAAADANEPTAEFALGQLLVQGQHDVPRDEAKGLALITRAAAHGYSPARRFLDDGKLTPPKK